MHGTRWEGEMKLERQVDGQRIRQWESYVLMRNSAKTPIAGGGGQWVEEMRVKSPLLPVKSA